MCGLFVPKTNFEDSTSWEKKMQDLAKSLVMISRPQYGLFVVSDPKNFELINTSKTSHEEDLNMIHRYTNTLICPWDN